MSKSTIKSAYVCPGCGAGKFSDGKCEYCGTIVDIDEVKEAKQKEERNLYVAQREEQTKKLDTESTIKKLMIASWILAGLLSFCGAGIITSLIAYVLAKKTENDNYKTKAIIALAINVLGLVIYISLV